ncbi:MAG TPA: hypothetical protein VN748_12025 [Pseudonocardiaceae bacterium]|nr:hypothetical protein [Pseudonocardiaceae bacterium]
MARRVARRGWIFLLVMMVMAGAAGVGFLLRDHRPIAGVGSVNSLGGSIRKSASPRLPEPGPPTVALADDAALNPDADRIRKVLQTYFDAINAGDYKMWRSAVIPQWARDTSEPAWRAQYRSTLDGSMVVHRLEPRIGGGLVALMSFTSLQNPADAPSELAVRCLHWWVSYPLIGQGEALRLGPSAPTANLVVAC